MITGGNTVECQKSNIDFANFNRVKTGTVFTKLHLHIHFIHSLFTLLSLVDYTSTTLKQSSYQL